jgi:hypothetical protein
VVGLADFFDTRVVVFLLETRHGCSPRPISLGVRDRKSFPWPNMLTYMRSNVQVIDSKARTLKLSEMRIQCALQTLQLKLPDHIMDRHLLWRNTFTSPDHRLSRLGMQGIRRQRIRVLVVAGVVQPNLAGNAYGDLPQECFC